MVDYMVDSTEIETNIHQKAGNNDMSYLTKTEQYYQDLAKKFEINQNLKNYLDTMPNINNVFQDYRHVSAKAVRDKTAYISHFLSLDSSTDLLPLFKVGQHGTLKEISESWAMWKAVRDYIESNTKRTKLRLVVVGDGCTARTGALFAYMTKWSIWSIDPNFRENPVGTVKVDRLQTFKMRIEDMPDTSFDEDLIIVMLHAHVAANVVLSKLTSKKTRHLVVCPCCKPGTQVPTKPQYLKEPNITYKDDKMLTDKNTIYIYKDI